MEWDDDRNRTSIVVAGPEGVGNYTLAMETLPQLLPALAACFYKAHQIEVRLPKLTPREREVFVFWRRGTARKEIAARLHISERSVYRHLNELREKVNLSGLDIRRPGRNQNN